jgi:site-specific DNA-methyltransferase (adenine-specific)
MDNVVLKGKWEELIKSVPDGSVSLVVADPPYGCTPNHWDEPWLNWRLFMREMGRVCGENGQMWVFCRLPWAVDLINASKKTGWSFVQERIWEKQNAGGATVRTFRKVHENIWHFKRKNANTFNLEDVRVVKTTKGNKSVKKRADSTTQYLGTKDSEYNDDGFRIPRSVQFHRNLHRSQESVGQQTQKPFGVIIPLVLYSSNPNDVILDPCCGSGSSLYVAKALGRKYNGFDADSKWSKIAEQRAKEATLEKLLSFIPKEERPQALKNIASHLSSNSGQKVLFPECYQ